MKCAKELSWQWVLSSLYVAAYDCYLLDSLLLKRALCCYFRCITCCVQVHHWPPVAWNRNQIKAWSRAVWPSVRSKAIIFLQRTQCVGLVHNTVFFTMADSYLFSLVNKIRPLSVIWLAALTHSRCYTFFGAQLSHLTITLSPSPRGEESLVLSFNTTNFH